jgi:hypothetical protein
VNPFDQLQKIITFRNVCQENNKYKQSHLQISQLTSLQDLPEITSNKNKHIQRKSNDNNKMHITNKTYGSKE